MKRLATLASGIEKNARRYSLTALRATSRSASVRPHEDRPRGRSPSRAPERATPSALALLPELLDPVLLVPEHLRRQRHRRRHLDVGQGHDGRLAPVRRDDVADDAALVAQVRHLGDRLPVPSGQGDLLIPKQPGERWREPNLEW